MSHEHRFFREVPSPAGKPAQAAVGVMARDVRVGRMDSSFGGTPCDEGSLSRIRCTLSARPTADVGIRYSVGRRYQGPSAKANRGRSFGQDDRARLGKLLSLGGESHSWPRVSAGSQVASTWRHCSRNSRQRRTFSASMRNAKTMSMCSGRRNPSCFELPHASAYIEDLTTQFRGLPGRAAIVRLRPHGRVYEHIDRGIYYQLRDRYHLVLRSRVGSRLRAGPEEIRMQEGELWWFDNCLPHEAFNDSDEPRLHLIFDILRAGSMARFMRRLLMSPRHSLAAALRKLRKVRHR